MQIRAQSFAVQAPFGRTCPERFSSYTRAMQLRTRKALGTIAFVVWLIVYSLVAMAIGGHFVVGSHMLVELGFYVLAVIPWVVGAMVIIKWMSGPAAE
jgi:hypothetical protein